MFVNQTCQRLIWSQQLDRRASRSKWNSPLAQNSGAQKNYVPKAYKVFAFHSAVILWQAARACQATWNFGRTNHSWNPILFKKLWNPRKTIPQYYYHYTSLHLSFAYTIETARPQTHPCELEMHFQKPLSLMEDVFCFHRRPVVLENRFQVYQSNYPELEMIKRAPNENCIPGSNIDHRLRFAPII